MYVDVAQCTGMGGVGLALRLNAGALAAAALLTTGAAAAETRCVTAEADGFEPPCNPYLASHYAQPHGVYAQGSTWLRGPESAGDVRRIVTGNTPFIPLAAAYSAPYSDGKRAVWAPGITQSQDSALGKLDEQTGEVIDLYNRATDEGSVPANEPAITRVYGVLDNQNRLFRAAGAAIEVIGDERPGDRLSPLALIKRFQLPPRALCREDDGVVGVDMRFDGTLAFVTLHGVVGVIPADPARMTDDHLLVHSINGARCDDRSVPLSELETTSNSLVADNRGAFYPVTTQALHKFAVRDGALGEVWRMPYQTGAAEGGGTRIDQGSGSTPDLIGTRREHDRMVVFSDGQRLMHLVVAWRDEIPKDWKGLPGRDRRIACEHPVTFGDPAREASQSEQSVATRGYSGFLVNNELRNVGAFGLVPLPQQGEMAVGGLFGQTPTSQPFGVERIDWDPRTRTCRSVWANKEVSIPNGVPYLSQGSRLLYGIAARDGENGLVGLDMDTGEERLFVSSGPEPSQNAFFSAVNIAPDGSAWTGGFFGFTKFEVGRTETVPASARVRLVARVVCRRRLRGRRVALVVRVRAEDLASGTLEPVVGAEVRARRRRARTRRGGVARLRLRPRRARRVRIAVSKDGFEPASIVVRLRRPRR